MPRMATSPPTPPWCSPRPRGRSRATSPRRCWRGSRPTPTWSTARSRGRASSTSSSPTPSGATRLRDCLKAGIGLRRFADGRRPARSMSSTSRPTRPARCTSAHARGAVVGDALANLLAKAGYAVTKEYYINDAGAQVDMLGRSTFLRYKEALGDAIGEIPEGLYPGEYLRTVGAGDRQARRRALDRQARGRLAAGDARLRHRRR